MTRKPFSYWRQQLFEFMQGRVNLARAVHFPNQKPPSYISSYANAEDFTLQNGKFYRPQRNPRQFRERELGRCFINALTLAEENPRELRYCEGFATVGFVPVEHAWNLDRRGRVIDVTWHWGDANEPDNPKAYCGVIYPTKIARRLYEARDYNSLLVDDWVRGWPLLARPYSARLLREVVRDLYSEGKDG